MHRILGIIVTFIGFFIVLSFVVPQLHAQICYPQRIINQFRCVTTNGQCIGGWERVCIGHPLNNGTGATYNQAYNSCTTNCDNVYGAGTCASDAFCKQWDNVSTCSVEESKVASCNTDPSICQANATIVSCDDYSQPSVCSESSQQYVYGCWGPGTPTSTPGPTPIGGGTWCGDGICNGSETAASCPGDCVTCTRGGWSNGACGPGNGCAYGERLQTRTVNPAGCDTTSQCVIDPTCNVGPSPIPTATPFVCPIPVMQAPINSQCATPTINGQIQWKWNPVAAANEYEISVVNVVTGIAVVAPSWRTSAAYTCGSGTCSYTTSHPVGTYYALVRARNTSGGCSVGPSATSAQQSVLLCPSTISAVGKEIKVADIGNCAAVNSSSEIFPVTFSSNSLNPVSKIQNDATPVKWDPVNQGSHTLSATTSLVDYNIQTACWNSTDGTSGTGLSATVQAGESVVWQVGFTLGQAWPQVSGGDAQICGTVKSVVPENALSGRYFNTNGPGGYPGVVTYGTDYQFDKNLATKGSDYVSTTNWLVDEDTVNACTMDWYSFIVNRYGLGSTVDKPAGSYSRADFPNGVYKVGGNMQTSGGDWTFPDGSNVVIFVEEDLTINNAIQVNGKSFVAFVVKGDILVNTSVGGAPGDTNANLEGVYISNGSFNTGLSSDSTSAKLIVNGIVIAGNFELNRDLDAYGNNAEEPSEVFIYDPMYLMTMPDEFMDASLQWSEVAP